MKQKKNEGYILIVSTVVLIGVAILGMTILETTYRDSMSTTAHKEKIRHFYASDGLMALLAQEANNGAIETYCKWDTLVPDSMMEIGSPPSAGTFTMGNGLFELTGTGIWSFNGAHQPDQMSLFNTRLGGDFEVRVRVDSLWADPGLNCWSRAAIMLRESAYEKSPMAAQYMCYGCGGEFVTRADSGENFSRYGSCTTYKPPYWLKIHRSGSTIWGSFSKDGLTWYVAGEDNIAGLPDSLYVGVFCARAWYLGGSETQENFVGGRFSNFSILSGSEVEYDIGDIPVYYSIQKMPGDLYQLKTDAYSLDNAGKKCYSAPLEFLVEPKGMQVPGKQVIYYPVIVYDYKGDCSNPNFNHCYHYTCSHGSIYDTLSPDLKPLLNYNPEVGTGLCEHRYIESTTCSWPDNRCADKLNEFFRISANGGPDDSVFFRFNTTANQWQWALVEDSTTNLPHYLGRTNEFVGPQFDDTYEMANVFWYDSLAFEYDPEVGEYRTIDSLPFDTYNRGFGNEGEAGNPCWAMEMHIDFTYNGGERIWLLTANGDAWIFLNGHRVLSLDGAVSNWTSAQKEVVLDDIADQANLVPGNTYRMDLFRCQRIGYATEYGGGDPTHYDGNALGFRMRTNVGFAETLTRTVWKRGLGDID